jgi:hypothetical protein
VTSLPDSPRPPPEAGTARERIDLAWNRSGLALVVCLAVLLRRIWPLRHGDQVVALASISAGAAAWALALYFGRSLSGGVRHRRGMLSSGVLGLMATGTVLLAVAGFVLGFFPPA